MARWTGVLLILATLAAGEEVNPVHPAAAQALARPEACIAYAEQVGDELIRRATKTETGWNFAKGESNVYQGDAGVALLFAGLFRATKKEKWREATRQTLDQAVASGAIQNGLYTGAAGIGEACVEAYWATGDEHFLKQARAYAGELAADFAATDVIFGAAGVGIFYLNLHKATGKAEDLAAARRAGDYLVKTARREKGLAHWPISAGNPKVYLGFSHGAAGSGYFLLHLGQRTKEEKYTTLAKEAAAYVLAHEIREGKDGANWERTVPPTPDDTIRIQWCHGSPGNGLFFSDLVRLGGDAAHRRALERCLATTRRHGRTIRRSGCQCHGVSGNAELFLFAHPVLKQDTLLEDARAFGSALLEPDGDGYRVRLGYDSSYMLGLAGIGHYFLRLADPAKTPLPMMVR